MATRVKFQYFWKGERQLVEATLLNIDYMRDAVGHAPGYFLHCLRDDGAYRSYALDKIDTAITSPSRAGMFARLALDIESI